MRAMSLALVLMVATAARADFIFVPVCIDKCQKDASGKDVPFQSVVIYGRLEGETQWRELERKTWPRCWSVPVQEGFWLNEPANMHLDMALERAGRIEPRVGVVPKGQVTPCGPGLGSDLVSDYDTPTESCVKAVKRCMASADCAFDAIPDGKINVWDESYLEGICGRKYGP